MTSTEAPIPPGVRKGELASLAAPVLNPADPTKLNVGLYPYVPVQAWFQKAISDAWAKLKHTYELNFVYYDAYSQNPGVDVFGFDAILLNDFKDYLGGFTTTSPLTSFLGWAPSDFAAGNNNVLGLPCLGCTNVLIYRTDDADLKNLKNEDLKLDKLQSIIPSNADDQLIPSQGKGIMLDMTGSTTLVSFYLQSLVQKDHTKAADPMTLPDPAHLDTDAVASLKVLKTIAGTTQATYNDTSGWLRAVKFLQGYGKAYVGYPEHLYYFLSKNAKNYSFYPLPLAKSQAVGTLLVYTDAIGINKSIASGKNADAVTLANLIAGQNVLDTAFETRDPDDGSPQFLTPVRQASLDALIKVFDTEFPLTCSETKKWVGQGATTYQYRLEKGYRPKVKSIAEALRKQLFGTQVADELAAADLQRPAPAPQYAETPGGLWRRGD